MERSFKRQFQPSISSYFGRISHASNTVEHSTPSTSIPTLPVTIQSSLLNVGMRVRKSVPEGYQTKSKMSSGIGGTIAHGTPSLPSEDLQSQVSDSVTAYRGLVPYCGILKIGGHSVQPVPAEEDLPPLQFDDEWSLPSSSQTSNTSSVMTNNAMPAPAFLEDSKKRRREDADDEDLGLEFQPVSPRSRPISHTRMPNLDQIRPIALPRSRRKVSVAIDEGVGLRESEMIDVGDFGEAPFFRPEEWGENWS